MRVYRVGKAWYASVYVGGVRVRRSTQCHDKRAAEIVAAGWERAAADPASAAQAQATLDDALDAFLSQRKEECAAGKKAQATVDFYEEKAGVLVRVLDGATPLAAITAAPTGPGDHSLRGTPRLASCLYG